jgi:xanthine dehydrogenase molybdenum-binding subunit
MRQRQEAKETNKMTEEFAVVGKRIPRRDAPEKTTGAAKYTVDIKLPGMLIGKVLRSPYPHAKIIKIDTSKAKKLRGVEAVITIDDVPNKVFNCAMSNAAIEGAAVAAEVTKAHAEEGGGLTEKAAFVGDVLDQRVLSDTARFMGDAIAAIAAIDEGIAEEALGLIDVEYEPLPAVFDPEEAMKPGAPIVHDATKNNVIVDASFSFDEDVGKGFKEADCVVEGTFRTSRQKHCQLEASGAVASFDANGRLTVWSPGQAPYPMLDIISGLFDIPEGMIRWLTPYVGGAFGHYTSLWAEPICIALAQKTGKPVKLVYTREEEFSVTDSRQPAILSGKMGVKKDSTITAIETKAITNAGAYVCHAASTSAASMAWFFASYHFQNREGMGKVVYTNTPCTGGFRGYGNCRGMFELEQLVDMAAENIGMDPLEFRLKNIKRTGEAGWVPGLPIENSGIEECIRRGAERIGWKEKWAQKKKEGIRRRGVGMACTIHSSSAYPFLMEHTSSFIKLNADGSANLSVNPVEIGVGIQETCAQIAAEALGVRSEDIHIVSGDTDINMYDLGTFSSRSTYVVGMSVLKAAQEAKEKLLKRASEKLGVSPKELEAREGQIYVKAAPEKRISVADVVRATLYNYQLGKGEHISGTCSFQPVQSPIFQASFAEVEVDTETGEVKVLRIIVAHDIGRAINPTTVEGQLQGGLIQGLGYALHEDLVIDSKTGKVLTDSFATYKIPSTLDIPEIEVILVEQPVASGPFGAKSVGESGMILVAPVIANAIYNAVGVRITELPMTPERVLKALKAK